MSARVYTMPALGDATAGAAESATLWLGDLRILHTADGWQVARPQASGGLVGICVAMSLAGALAAARAAQAPARQARRGMA